MESRAKKVHGAHEGERALQKSQNVPSEIADFLEDVVRTEMPLQHSEFFQHLMYLPIGTTDVNGLLHATILTNPKTEINDASCIVISSKVCPKDPFVKACLSDLQGNCRYFAAVGVDFSNRRRNKMAGYIEKVEYETFSSKITLWLKSNESMGNCPKYITVRNLKEKRRESKWVEKSRFDEDCLRILNNASTVFIASRHFNDTEEHRDMGFNHRGGAKGFVRFFKDEEGSFLILPDFSGNRFFQSLGNIELENQVALCIPNFDNGDVVHISSGKAVNLFGSEAQQLMPRCSLVTKIRIDSTTLIEQEMQLEMIGEEQYSPYNPPLRLLASESKIIPGANGLMAKLMGKRVESKLVSTFTFEIEEKIELLPGQFAIFDFSNTIDKPYMHMNNQNPKLVNDDLVRTWTVSGVNKQKNQFSITVKLKEGGLISSILHKLEKPIPFMFKGFGGEFTCVEKDGKIPSKMLWIAGGVGITPFLAFDQYIKENNLNAKAALLYSCKEEESGIAKNIQDTILFSTRRINKEDLLQVVEKGIPIYMCGPVSFMNQMRQYISEIDCKIEINIENFTF